MNIGEPHLDGEGEYTPPKSGGKDLDDLVNDTSDDGKGETPAVLGPDLEIGSDNEPIDESGVELSPSDGVEFKTPTPEEEYAPNLEDAVNNNPPLDEGTMVNQGPEEVVEEGAVPDNIDIPITDAAPVSDAEKNIDKETGIDLNKTVTEHKLTLSNKPGFDPTDTQDARRDGNQEGGIARNRTTGNQFHSHGKPEGAQLRPSESTPDYSKMFEVSGFTVSFEKVQGQGNVNVEIRDHFVDIETAMASVNGEKYLMPIPQTGFKVVEIVSGAPTISYQDRVMYEYINGKWRRK